MQALKRSAHAGPGHRKFGQGLMVACNTAGAVSAPFDDAGTTFHVLPFPKSLLSLH